MAAASKLKGCNTEYWTIRETLAVIQRKVVKSKLAEKGDVDTVKEKNGETDDFKKYLRDKTNKSLFLK